MLRALVTTFGELRDDLASVHGAKDALDAVTRVAVSRVPGAESASITVKEDTSFSTRAATDDLAVQADKIQYDVGSGPCIDAILEDTVYHPGDLAHDTRWPEYGRRVSEEIGVRSMLSYRLSVEVDHMICGMNIYSRDLDVFNDDAVLTGLLLATHGAMAVAAAGALDQVANLQKALASNREIGTAMGILMATHKITREQAFDLLRITSQSSNRKLREIATEVADTGVLALPTPVKAARRR